MSGDTSAPRICNVPFTAGALVVVGQCNPYHPSHERADMALFSRPLNSAGGRLLALARDAVAVDLPPLLGQERGPVPALLAEWAWLALAERHNLCDVRWNDHEARHRAGLMQLNRAGRPVLLLGRRVSAAWTYPGTDTELFAERDHEWIIPHTSGKNRSWQVAGNYVQARRAVAEAIGYALAWSSRGNPVPLREAVYA